MAINIDTKKIRENGTDLVNLSKEMTEILDTMYEKINDLPKAGGSWEGESTAAYIKNANLDKLQYQTFIKDFYAMGKYLIDYADHMDSVIGEVSK